MNLIYLVCLLVYIQSTQQFLNSSTIHETTMHTLYNSAINNNIFEKDQHDSNKNRAVNLINSSAKIIRTSRMDQ